VSLRSEILDQPAVLARLLATRMDVVRRIVQEIERRDIEFVLLAARGTSDNAGLYAKYLWGIENQIPVALAAPSMFGVYRSPPRLRRALVVGISQSGQSPDIVNVVQEGRRQGAATLAITNDASSSLAHAADHVIFTDTGTEQSVAATKTYTAQLMAIAMISIAWRGGSQGLRALERVPDLVTQALGMEPAVEQAAASYRDMTKCVVLGRGFNYATAHEWALKLTELAYVVALPYSSADFLHGPVAMLDRGFPVLVVAPEAAVLKDLLPVLRELGQSRGTNLLAVSNHLEVLQLASTPLVMPTEIPEWLSPLVAIVPAQLFCLHLGALKGLDVEHPRGLQKVTKTW
jgi:glucosamine--fructose-6-phosphate aminotransferase (isomerizing)